MNNENYLESKLLWCIWGVITLSAVVLINNYSPYIPDYDGLSYFEYVKIYNDWQFNYGDLKFSSFNKNDTVYNWPITNALSVFFAAILSKTIDLNLIPTLINAIYLLIFMLYVSKIRSNTYACIAALLLCGHTFFYRLFTTLTSEFSVGLWIFALILTLISKHERRLIFLSALVVIGLFLRTIDIIFVLSSAGAYSTLHILLYKDKKHLLDTLRCIFLTLTLTAPIFFQHYRGAYFYVLETQSGVSKAAWQAMAGVFSRLDVSLRYVEYLNLYNSMQILVCIIVIFWALFISKLIKNSIVIIIGTSLAAIFPLLISATINVQTTFWVFSAIAFIVCELTFDNITVMGKKLQNYASSNFLYKYISLRIISLFSFTFMRMSWGVETQYLSQQKKVSEISFDIAKVLNIEPDNKFITANFRGIGPLDNLGLSWNSTQKLIEGSVSDIYTKEHDANYYLNFDKKVSFFISAHDNYFFPLSFGINDHVKEINAIFNLKSTNFGFIKVSEISKHNTNFDIWYRPSANPHLQFLDFKDKWIATNLPIEFGKKDLCKNHTLSGKIVLNTFFPNPNLPTYAPPFSISLLEASSNNLISSTTVIDYGYSELTFKLKNLECGKYNLYFNKTFSTKADERRLSAQFITLDSALKFDLNEKGSE